MLSSKLLRNFFTLFTLLSLLFFSLLFTEGKSHKEESVRFMKITHIPSLALSTSFLESRILLYKDATNRLYPKMKHTQEMDFVYAR